MPTPSRCSPLVASGYWLAGVAATAYIVARAWLVPLTYDEAVVALRYMSAPWSHVFEVGSGTNHFLNTVLARAVAALCGAEPWAIRLPNVFAGVGYLVAMAAITRRLSSSVLGLAGFVLLIAHPFLLDYFAVSRGYGLGIGLLGGSLWALLRWCDDVAAPHRPRRHLAAALTFAAAAVAASFTVLPAVAGVLTIVLVRLLWRGRRQAGPTSTHGWQGLWRDALAWALVTGLFSVAVFSRDRELSAEVFETVTVRVIGLLPDEVTEVEVLRSDAAGRVHPLDRQPGGHWTLANPRGVYGLRIELPARSDRNLSSLEVAIGAETFHRTRRDAGPWQVRDNASVRVLTSTPALRTAASFEAGFGSINMRGGAAHRRAAWRYAALVLALLAAIGIVVTAVFVVVARLRGVDAADLRLVLRAGMAIAALCAAPAYLLRVNNQLYFGGTTGLLTDTFGSVLAAIVYVVPAWPGQGVWAMRVLVVLAVLVVAALTSGRLRRASAPLAISGILVVVALQVEAQHRLLQTPYLIDRTALFVLPLLVLTLVLSAGVVAARARPLRWLMSWFVAVLAAGSVWQGVTVANLSQSRDVPSDASTPAMLQVLAADTAAGAPGRPAVVRLGVEWMYFPVAQYYAARLSTPQRRYDVSVVPDADDVSDYRYCRTTAACMGEVRQAFPLTGTVLRRSSP